MLRQTLFLPLIVAAIGGPMLFFSGDKKQDEEKTDELGDFTSTSLSQPLEPKNIYTPSGSAQEIFSFQLTPDWIKGNWENVTESEIDGFRIYRASILSGHQNKDIVGAVTYQFNFRQKMKSIQFSGFVTDPSELIGILTRQFGFRASAGMGEYETGGLSGFDGKLSLHPSSRFKGQLEVELQISR